MKIRFPWSHPGQVIRALVAVGLVEAARNAFLIGILSSETGQEYLGVNKAAAGLLYSLHLFADLFLKGPTAWISNRLGFGRILLFSSASALFFTTTILGSTSLPLWLLLVLWGFLVSPLWPSVLAFANSRAIPGKESRAATWAFAFSAPLAGLSGIAMVYLYLAKPELGAQILYWGQMVTILFAITLVSLKIPLIKKKELGYRWTKLAILLPAAFCQQLAPSLFNPVLSTYLHEMKLGPLMLGITVVIGAVVGFFLMHQGARFADRRGPRAVLILGVALMATTGFFLARQDPSFFPWIGLLAGAAISLFVAGWNGLVVQVLPQAERATAWGILMSVEALGQTAGPTLGSLALAEFGLQGPFILAAYIMVAVGVFYLWDFWRSR